MCSCHRDGKPHTDACQRAHHRYDGTTKGLRRKLVATHKRRLERIQEEQHGTRPA